MVCRQGLKARRRGRPHARAASAHRREMDRLRLPPVRFITHDPVHRPPVRGRNLLTSTTLHHPQSAAPSRPLFISLALPSPPPLHTHPPTPHPHPQANHPPT